MAEVFVTGGSGFIGRALIRRLAADGHTVRALVRSPAAFEQVANAGAFPVHGDLLDANSVRAAVQGCELVFHLAAQTDPAAGWAAHRRVTVDGTRSVLRACKEAGVPRLVHASTEAVLMTGQRLVDVDETAPLRPDSKAAYPATKAAAEQMVRDANGAALETVVVRPRFVWGAGDTSLLPVLVEAARSGRLRWISGGRHLTDVTHVDNAVEGLVLAALRGASGGVYFVTDDHLVTFRSFVSELLRTQGVEPPTRSIPGWLARAGTATGEATWRWLRLSGRPPLDRMALWLMSLDCTLDITRARTDLGYRPVRTHESGLADMRTATALTPEPTPAHPLPGSADAT